MNLLNKMRQTKWKITMVELKQNKRQIYMTRKKYNPTEESYGTEGDSD